MYEEGKAPTHEKLTAGEVHWKQVPSTPARYGRKLVDGSYRGSVETLIWPSDLIDKLFMWRAVQHGVPLSLPLILASMRLTRFQPCLGEGEAETVYGALKLDDNTPAPLTVRWAQPHEVNAYRHSRDIYSIIRSFLLSEGQLCFTSREVYARLHTVTTPRLDDFLIRRCAHCPCGFDVQRVLQGAISAADPDRDFSAMAVYQARSARMMNEGNKELVYPCLNHGCLVCGRVAEAIPADSADTCLAMPRGYKCRIAVCNNKAAVPTQYSSF